MYYITKNKLQYNSSLWQYIFLKICHYLKQDEKTMEKPDLEAKVRASGFGAHTTTLSSKYDARKPDESWHCVFCKRSSHYQVT